jgi:hypothetical protein
MLIYALPISSQGSLIMSKTMRGVFVLMLLLSVSVTSSPAADDDEMVDNPRYKFWANFKPGATSTYTQTTKLHGPEKATVPGGVEEKKITYRLLSVSKDRVVVLTTVVEEDFLSTVESAPTRITFPAKVKKANLQAVLQEWNSKEGSDETIKVGDKEITCKVKAGSHKSEDGTVEAKLCFSDAVPGGVVKHTRTTRDGEKAVAETTTSLVSFAESRSDKRD